MATPLPLRPPVGFLSLDLPVLDVSYKSSPMLCGILCPFLMSLVLLRFINLFTFLMVSLETTVFNFDEVPLIFFSFVTCAFGVTSKKPLLTQSHEDFLPYFPKIIFKIIP